MLHGRYPLRTTTAPSDSCPDIHPNRSPKFLAELSVRAIPLCPAMLRPSLYHCVCFFSSGRILASCPQKHWPHGICVTRLYPWVHFRYGSHICKHRASPRRSPFTMPASLLMQWSIHKANTFQFASSAKLCLAHRRAQRTTPRWDGLSEHAAARAIWQGLRSAGRASPRPILAQVVSGRFRSRICMSKDLAERTRDVRLATCGWQGHRPGGNARL